MKFKSLLKKNTRNQKVISQFGELIHFNSYFLYF
jgi:hypothetical protein